MREPDEIHYSAEELAEILEKMRRVSATFYSQAIQVGNHAFIEFTGLMNEYIKICAAALEQGIDFTAANIHGGLSLPMEAYHRAYLMEKLECIYGTSLAKLADETLCERSVSAASAERDRLRKEFEKAVTEDIKRGGQGLARVDVYWAIVRIFQQAAASGEDSAPRSAPAPRPR